MRDVIVERRPVQGSPRRVKRAPQEERSLQQRCVDLLQAKALPMAERVFVRYVSQILLEGGELKTEQKDYLLHLWTDYCRWGAG